MSTYNIYCDESSVENINLRFMVIGALFLPRLNKKKEQKKLKAIKLNYKFYGELKWSKICRKNLPVMKSIINYVLENKNYYFRFIVVDKKKIDLKSFHQNDNELAFFKFYYFMLRNRLLDGNSYYLFLDKKPTRERNKIQSLRSFLMAYIYSHRNDCSIKHMQAYDSKENIFIQIIDLLTGALAYSRNYHFNHNQSAKSKLLKHVMMVVKNEGLKPTSLSEDKFNIFEWKPKNENN